MKSIYEKKKIIAYIAITLVLSFLYQGIIALVASDTNSHNFINLALILMYFPGLIALVFILIYKEKFKRVEWGIKHPIFLLYSIAIPLAITFLWLFLIEFFRLGNQTIFLFKNNMIIFLDKQISIITFMAYFLTSLVLGSVQAGIFTMGEELGWRGYLQNKMIREFGIIRGVIFLGLVWGYWHLPIILMGYNFPEYRILGGFVLMPLMTIGFSGVWAWLTLRAKSILPAILAHGAVNTLLSDSFIKRVYVEPKIWMYILLTGLWLIAGIIAIIRLNLHNKK